MFLGMLRECVLLTEICGAFPLDEVFGVDGILAAVAEFPVVAAGKGGGGGATGICTDALFEESLFVFFFDEEKTSVIDFLFEFVVDCVFADEELSVCGCFVDDEDEGCGGLSAEVCLATLPSVPVDEETEVVLESASKLDAVASMPLSWSTDASLGGDVMSPFL